MTCRIGGRRQMAATLARTAQVPAIVIGRMALAEARVIEGVMATSAQGEGPTRAQVAREIGRAVAPLIGLGAAPDLPRPAGASDPRPGRPLWLTSERCLVGVWPHPPAMAPFVALVADGPEEMATRARRDAAMLGLIYEAERSVAEEPAPDAIGAAAGHGALAEDLLRMVAVGLVLCDPCGKVTYANPAARERIGASRALALAGERLVARRPDLRARLQAAPAAAAAGEPRVPAALALPRGGGDPVPEVATVIPFGPMPRAPVVLGELGWDVERGDLVLRALGLTAAERRLAGHLCRGRPLEVAAAAAEVTISTARTYLKRIFAKTGANRQSQLVALLAALSPPVAPPLVGPAPDASARGAPRRPARLVSGWAQRPAHSPPAQARTIESMSQNSNGRSTSIAMSRSGQSKSGQSSSVTRMKSSALPANCSM